MSANSCARKTARTTAPVPLSWAYPLPLPVREKGTVPRHLAPRTEDSLVRSEAAVSERPQPGRKVLFPAEGRNPPRGPPARLWGPGLPSDQLFISSSPTGRGKGEFKEEKQQGAFFSLGVENASRGDV